MPDADGPKPIIPVTDSQAKAVAAIASLGQTVVEEGGQLARYIGRVLGVAPDDAVGIVIGDPLHFIRAAIAKNYDDLLTKIFEKRHVKKTDPVSPSVAIPLLRAAYDESRPELQELWAELIAAAMDPTRSGQVRLSFITTVKQLDPLDALVLKELYNEPGPTIPNPRDFLTTRLNRSPTDIELTVDNLASLRCVFRGPSLAEFHLTTYGRELARVCSG